MPSRLRAVGRVFLFCAALLLGALLAGQTRADEGYAASNISSTTATFRLVGGLYGIDYVATWGGGSVTLQKLAGDGTTYVTAATAFSANGYATAYLAPGVYRLAVATASAVYVVIDRVPVTRGG